MSWPRKGHRKAVRAFQDRMRDKPGKTLIEVFEAEDKAKQPKKLSDEELKSHVSPYWKKASERGREQLPNSITDKL